ncbi:hypothetical protein HYU11_05825 [Candidatus Woesearchaeota archaeon]|nr:hypothetical protein [Candidatus Woesearchaeota archaeon]
MAMQTLDDKMTEIDASELVFLGRIRASQDWSCLYEDAALMKPAGRGMINVFSYGGEGILGVNRIGNYWVIPQEPQKPNQVRWPQYEFHQTNIFYGNPEFR